MIADGDTAWLWQSTANTVTQYALPAHGSVPPPATPALTPQQAAQQVLAAVGPTTTVSVDSNVTVAGQAAYELVLAPKDSRSLVGQVQIAVDGRNGVPLRLQVYARGASTPAFQVGYTAIQFVTPAPAELTFTPPPGAKVTKDPWPAAFVRPVRPVAGREHHRIGLADRARRAFRGADRARRRGAAPARSPRGRTAAPS